MGQGRSADSSPVGGAEGRCRGGLLAAGERRGLVWLASCGLLAVLAYRDLLSLQPDRSLPQEIEEWFFVPSRSIAPVVVLMSLWLLYRRIRRLLGLPSTPGTPVPGLALLLAGGAIYLWAIYTGAEDLLVPSLMLNGLACAWLWKGGPALRAVLLPVAFLIFAMPPPPPLLNEVIFHLQIWTAELAGELLYALGIPNLVEGERIIRSNEAFSIIEACSGLRSMETLAMVAVLMLDLFRRSGLHAWLLFLAAPPVAFLLNGLRAVLLILNPHSELAPVHNLQGVAILLCGLVLLFLWDGLLGRVLPQGEGQPAPHPASAPRRARPRARAAAVAAALGLASAGSLWLPRWEDTGVWAGSIGPRLSAELGQSVDLPVERVFLGSVSFLEIVHKRFEGPDGPVILFLGVGSRALRAYSVLSPKTGLPGTGWIQEGAGWAALEPAGPPVSIRVLRSGSLRSLVAHWYEGAGPWGVEVLRSLLAVDRSPWRKPGAIVAVRVAVPILGAGPAGLEEARGRLEEFTRRLRPALEEERVLWKKSSRFSTSGKRFSLRGGGKRAVTPVNSMA